MMSMEIRSTDKGGKIKLESDSNSLAARLLIARAMIEDVGYLLENLDKEKLSEEDQMVVDWLADEVSALDDQFSFIDQRIDGFDTDSEFAFFYENCSRSDEGK